MGTDTPIAVLSKRPRLLFDYFSQLFAQVTNSARWMRSVRELVTSTKAKIGPEGNLLQPGPTRAVRSCCPTRILSNEDLAKILYIDEDLQQAPAQANGAASDGAAPARCRCRPGSDRSRSMGCTP